MKPHWKSPEGTFRGDKQALRFVDMDELANAFLHCETRKVDKAGCISFQDRKYEVGLSFIGCTVDVVYDPMEISKLTIEYEGHAPWTVKELVIGAQAGKRPPLPTHLQKQPAKSSRLLTAAEAQSDKRHSRQVQAVAYRSVHKVDNNV